MRNDGCWTSTNDLAEYISTNRLISVKQLAHLRRCVGTLKASERLFMPPAVRNMRIVVARSDECATGGLNRLKHEWTSCTENMEDASSSATAMYHCIIVYLRYLCSFQISPASCAPLWYPELLPQSLYLTVGQAGSLNDLALTDWFQTFTQGSKTVHIFIQSLQKSK